MAKVFNDVYVKNDLQVKGDILAEGMHSYPNGDAVIGKNLEVDGDLQVNTNALVNGSLSVNTLKVGEINSESDVYVGDELHIPSSDRLICDDGTKIGGASLYEHSVYLYTDEFTTPQGLMIRVFIYHHIINDTSEPFTRNSYIDYLKSTTTETAHYTNNNFSIDQVEIRNDPSSDNGFIFNVFGVVKLNFSNNNIVPIIYYNYLDNGVMKSGQYNRTVYFSNDSHPVKIN